MKSTHHIAQYIAVVALAIGALVVTSSAQAAPGEKMKAIDKNQDGMISRAEASGYPRLAKHFDLIDTNKDGQLSRDEMKAQHQRKVAAKLKVIDANKDGRISRAEADAKAPRLAKNFDRIDTNKDGFLSKEELHAARSAMKAGR